MVTMLANLPRQVPLKAKDIFLAQVTHIVSPLEFYIMPKGAVVRFGPEGGKLYRISLSVSRLFIARLFLAATIYIRQQTLTIMCFYLVLRTSVYDL